MPMYEYECEACGSRFEQIRKFSDPPVKVCPSCGKPKVRKLVSSPAIQFKGSGFYINDYAKKGAAGTDTADTKESASKESSKDSSKESTTSSPDSSSSKSTASSSSTDSTAAAPSSKSS